LIRIKQPVPDDCAAAYWQDDEIRDFIKLIGGAAQRGRSRRTLWRQPVRPVYRILSLRREWATGLWGRPELF